MSMLFIVAFCSYTLAAVIAQSTHDHPPRSSAASTKSTDIQMVYHPEPEPDICNGKSART